MIADDRDKLLLNLRQVYADWRADDGESGPTFFQGLMGELIGRAIEVIAVTPTEADTLAQLKETHRTGRIVGALIGDPDVPVSFADQRDEPGGEVKRLREAIEQALRCTPRIVSKYVGIAGMPYRAVIEYDCGNPWTILRSALSTPATPTDTRGGESALRDRVEQALNAELADSYDCQRVWSAWDVGTMDEGDFVPVSERIGDIVDSVIAALASPAAPGGVLPPGWVAVPVEPTEAMLHAYDDCPYEGGEDKWSALLAARPPLSGDRT